ncbi:hypothetical protein D1AOALGA4SA_3477 [Olavius algarvensis Delta 1 endosymbiont]|nr:hypothetical protein D1AOALGA4SA_3477 [Olavius algarvensis Delta 1 endosymbiont]
MGKAYNIVNIVKIYDQEKFQRYIDGHIPTISKFRGKFLIKGNSGEVLEGNWPSNLIVIHEFPSAEQFKAWYYSEDYRPWKELRQSCADVNVILTQGD